MCVRVGGGGAGHGGLWWQNRKLDSSEEGRGTLSACPSWPHPLFLGNLSLLLSRRRETAPTISKLGARSKCLQPPASAGRHCLCCKVTQMRPQSLTSGCPWYKPPACLIGMKAVASRCLHFNLQPGPPPVSFPHSHRSGSSKTKAAPSTLCSSHTASHGHYSLPDRSSSCCLASFQRSSHTGLPVRRASGRGRTFAFAIPPPNTLSLLNFCEPCSLTSFRDLVKP